jgi:hypothetical protein
MYAYDWPFTEWRNWRDSDYNGNIAIADFLTAVFPIIEVSWDIMLCKLLFI